MTVVAFWTTMRIEWIWRVPQLLLPPILVLARREGAEKLGLSGKNFFKNIELGILVAALLTAVTAPLYLRFYPSKMPTDLYLDVWLWVIIFASINIFAIEIFYRGCLQTKLTAMVGFAPGLIVTSLLCGLDFFEFKIFGPVFTVGVAFILGFLYFKTRSLVATVTAHLLWVLFLVAVAAS